MALFSYGPEVIGDKAKTEDGNGFKFSGTIGLNSNGIFPVPAFSLGKPAIMGFFSLRKNRFSLDPKSHTLLTARLGFSVVAFDI